MKTHSPRRAILGLIALSALILAAFVFARSRGVSEQEIRPAETSSPSTSRSDGLEPPLSNPELDLEGYSRARAVERIPSRVLCLLREGRAPIEGVAPFSGTTQLEGKSGTDGVLELFRAKGQAIELWAEGLIPVVLRKFDETPETVLFDAADARLDVFLIGMAADDEVVRTLLQPHAFHVAGDEPWRPTLESVGPNRLSAERLPPGEYDVYVWVSRPGDAARSLSAARVSITATEPVRVELDASRPPEPEADS